jgi:hypothetical protein
MSMRQRATLACLALILATSSSRADILPEPDRGPPMASTAGLDFAVQSVEVKYPPGYTKMQQVVVLTGCTDGHPNCGLARSKNLIGMEVNTVDDQYLLPENGMVQQIVDAFENKKGDRTVTLELYSRASNNNETIKVSFVKH